MAIETVNAQWIDVYANGRKSHSGSPMGIGGSAQYTVFIRIPDSVKTLIRSSSTTASLDMQVNVTNANSEMDVGHHRESNSRPNGSNGIPWYAYNETWRYGGTTGTKTYQMSNWFMPNFLNGNTQGIVLFSYNGKFYNEINSVSFRVHGTWNRPPTTPSNVRVDKTRPDISQVVRWNASSDPDGDTVRYDVEFYNGSSWTRMVNSTTSLSWTHNTTNARAVTNARYRVRAVDGKEASSWAYSPTFEIRHVPPTIAESRLTYLDSNTTTRTITGNNQHIIQNASTVQASVASGATANDGKTIKRYIFTLSGQERIRTSVGSVTFGPINAGTNQTLRVTVEDSAGLRSSVTKTVTVIPYSPPEIQYEANRVGSIENNTILKVSGSISSLGGKNALQLTQYRYRRTGTTNWSSTFTINRSVSGTNFTGRNVTINLDSGHEWEIEVIVSDKVLTRRVYLTVSRGKPVMFLDEEYDRLGIGKYPERGSLDLEGEMYASGSINLVPFVTGGLPKLKIFSADSNGHSYIEYMGNDQQRKAYMGISTTQHNHFTVNNENADGDILLSSGTGRVRVGWTDIVESGANQNGGWVRFYDGTQICWKEGFNVSGQTTDPNVLTGRWTFPIEFVADTGQVEGRPAGFVTKNEYSNSAVLRGSSSASRVNKGGRTMDAYLQLQTGGSSSWSHGVRVMAIGRWK